ncbi:MAG: PepSY domain-containing protein [Cyanobacteriota bacterium]|nr:PepSY domain-containing protein [Cyanobacteriota bacterium]
MNKQTFRKIHRKIAPILFLPLILSALTGIGYRLGKSWFGMSGEDADIFMVIHQGEYLGEQLKPIYVLLLGLGLLGAIATGLTMTALFAKNAKKRANSQLNFRQIHRLLAPIIFLPLIVSALTGIIYRLGKSWFGMSPDTANIFMVIHQGQYFGDVGKPIYVLLVGLGLIVMLITGINMTGIFRQRSPQV